MAPSEPAARPWTTSAPSTASRRRSRPLTGPARSGGGNVGDGGDRRSFFRAVTIGAVLALVVDVLMISAGAFSLTRQAGSLGTFYDVQGHAFLDGRLNVPAAAVS